MDLEDLCDHEKNNDENKKELKYDNSLNYVDCNEDKLKKMGIKTCEEYVDSIYDKYKHWTDYLNRDYNKKEFKNQDAFDKVKNLYFGLVEDNKDYFNILFNESRLIDVLRYILDKDDYIKRVENIDRLRRRKHDSIIQKYGIINRILYNNIGDKVFYNDSIGVYFGDPYDLYKDPKKDIVKGVTETERRENVAKTSVLLTYAIVNNRIEKQ